MTSTPASRSARATTLAPRSCPSSPGFATRTRMLPTPASSEYQCPATGISRQAQVTGSWGRACSETPCSAARRARVPEQALELLDRGVAQDQLLEPVLAAEVDLGFGPLAGTVDG